MCKRAVEQSEEEIAAAALAEKKAAKKAKKAAAAAAAEPEPEAVEEDAEAAALAAKKAAKKAKKAAAAAAAELEAEAVEEDPEAAALAAKKAAKKAKKAAAAAAAAVEEEEEAPAPKKGDAAPAPKKEEPAAEDEEFKDNTYKCSDCSEDWVDTVGEQQFRWDKGFAEVPKRCKDCRWAKKVRMEGGDPTAKGKAKGKGKGNKELEIFIGGLPFSTTEEVLQKDFAECGEIVNFRMPLNDEGNARGIAFVEYANMEGVEKALKFNETEYGGRWLSVRKSGDDSKGKGKGKDDKGKGKNKGNKEFEVFVGGLPFSTTEEALKKDFTECGEIVNFRMPLNDEGNARGIAFIEYKDKESVEKALKFNETDYGGRTLSVKMSGDGGGKDGKGKDGKGKGKGKKGKKGKATSESFAKNTGAMVESTGVKQTFADSDEE